MKAILAAALACTALQASAQVYKCPGPDDAQKVWGRPERVNRSTTAAGTREQWVYGTVHKREYLYFQNGVLVTIQD